MITLTGMPCRASAKPWRDRPGWLDRDQQRAWLAYIRVQLRLAYEMNRQLLADSGMSLPDYDVLTALSASSSRARSHRPLAGTRRATDQGPALAAPRSRADIT